MRIVIFCHSIISDWNHGNAHFLRGIASELISRGHEAIFYEPRNAWSLRNLLADHGEAAIAKFHRAYPSLTARRYDQEALDLEAALDGADIVLVHEWNDHNLVKRIGELRARSHAFRLFFHDTHHRAVTDQASMSRYDLRHYDGVLAFGEVLRDIYIHQGWTRAAWTWHEAADTRMFRPLESSLHSGELVWIGNWGDEERSGELREFILDPVKALSIRAHVYGVRYPESALLALRQASISYGGWLPNFEVAGVFARFKLTLHVPRRPYAHALPGIPTIRLFEAMACAIPLICAPWDDAEGLFSPGSDFLMARDGDETKRHIRGLLNDRAMANEIATHAHGTILARHTCAHRVDQLFAIYRSLAPRRDMAICTGR